MIFWQAVRAAALAGLGVAGAWSVRLAVADYWFQRDTVEGTRKAIALMPDQSAYRVRLALLAGDADRGEAIRELRRAVGLNPADGRAWIELGLRLESAGELAAAEEPLLRAAAEDHTYLPRWTLMNYYFRRGNRERFWYWAKAAVPMTYGDPRPLFHLCGLLEEDGRLIERLDIREQQMQARYLVYLLDIGRAALAGPASRSLLAGRRVEDAPLLLDACGRLIEARRIDDAVAVWKGLGGWREPGGSLVTNGDFAKSPGGLGFDWRLTATEGVSAAREENPSALRLTFSGSETEMVEPLAQWIAVEPDTEYELHFASRTSGIADDSGLAWRVAGADDSEPKVEVALAAEGRMQFRTAPGCRLVRLSLVYRRRSGTTRIAGYVVLWGVELRRSRPAIL